MLNPLLINKFHGLLKFLSKTETQIEMVADEIADGNLRVALNGLSTQTFQCANEICMQLKSHGISPYTPSLSINEENETDNWDTEDILTNSNGNELLNLCNRFQNLIIKSYHEILNEFFPFPSLRQIMNYQLDVLNCTFMKIKMLNDARFLSASA